MIDLFGHIAYIVLLVGVWLLSKQRVIGWVVHGTGTAMWLVLGILMDSSAIWVWSSVFVVMDVVGFYRWRTKHEKTN